MSDGASILRYTLDLEVVVNDCDLQIFYRDSRALAALAAQPQTAIKQATIKATIPIVEAKFVSGIFYKAE